MDRSCRWGLLGLEGRFPPVTVPARATTPTRCVRSGSGLAVGFALGVSVSPRVEDVRRRVVVRRAVVHLVGVRLGRVGLVRGG